MPKTISELKLTIENQTCNWFSWDNDWDKSRPVKARKSLFSEGSTNPDAFKNKEIEQLFTSPTCLGGDRSTQLSYGASQTC